MKINKNFQIFSDLFCFEKKIKVCLYGQGFFLSKMMLKQLGLDDMIAVVFIACHAFVVAIIVWDHPLVLLSDDGSDVLEPASGI